MNTEIRCLGKVVHAKELVSLVSEINSKLETGEPAWRLPSKDELIASQKAKDHRFGEWFTWSGDAPSEYSDTLWIVNMSNGDVFSDSDGSEVEAYLVH